MSFVGVALALERVQDAARIMGMKDLRPKVVWIGDAGQGYQQGTPLAKGLQERRA